MENDQETITWLLDSDPSIRWQVMKDLQELDEAAYSIERQKLTDIGWCARLLSLQDQDGLWSGSLYNGKWVSTTYTLYLLKLLGLRPQNPQAIAACEQLFTQGIYKEREIRFSRGQRHQDLGVTGLVLSLCFYFGYQHDLLSRVVEYLISQQGEGGYWLANNSEATRLYRFETTLLVLEGLRQYRDQHHTKDGGLLDAEVKGQEFLLRHQLYLDAGKAIKNNWISFSFPPYWFYDVLTALDYFRQSGTHRDVRFQPGIGLVVNKQNNDGRWRLGRKHPGKSYFEMEEQRAPSKWITLRALRVLMWWQNSH